MTPKPDKLVTLAREPYGNDKEYLAKRRNQH